MNNKHAISDGIVGNLLKNQPIPPFYKVRQLFDATKIENVEIELTESLKKQGTLDLIKPGSRIAITVGSRGIKNIDAIVTSLVEKVKKCEALPFIIPAMGSHGGATAEGQLRLLADYNVTPENIGCPVLSSMETTQIGTSDNGNPVYMDKLAFESDGVIVLNRIKPHTAYRGTFESGLIKMCVIGLGKQLGAETCHSQGMGKMAENLVSMGKTVLESGKILFGIAIVENAYDQTMLINAIPAQLIYEEEPKLLKRANTHMPSILIEEFDALIVDEIGKNISGDGMDPNITGNFATPYASGGAKKQRIAVLDITEKSHGNGLGLGLADFTTQRAFDKFDFEMTYPNVITNTNSFVGKLPLVMANDKLAIQAAVKTCNCIDQVNPRIVRIRNTMELETIYISEALYNEASKNPNMEIIGKVELEFNANGNLDFSKW